MHQIFHVVKTQTSDDYYQGFAEYCLGYRGFYLNTETGAEFYVSDFSTMLYYRCPYEKILYDNFDLLPVVTL